MYPIYKDDNGTIVLLGDNHTICLNNPNGNSVIIDDDKFIFTDRYGDKLTLYRDEKIVFDRTSPSYEELYDHWLKTKQND